MGLGQKIRSMLMSEDTSLAYDNISQESRSLFVANEHVSGGRADITKQVGNFQLSSSWSLGKQSLFQASTVYTTPNFTIQSVLDQDRSWQCRAFYGYRGFGGRLQALYSKRNVFSQIEVGKSVKNTNFCAKVISPAIPRIRPVYVFNLLSRFGKYHLGFETVFSKAQSLEVGLGLGFRRETESTATVLGLHQLTTLSFTHFKQFSPIFSGALDFNYSVLSKELHVGAAWHLKTKNASVKTQIDTSGKITSVIENKLSENLTLNFSTETDMYHDATSVGIFFNLII